MPAIGEIARITGNTDTPLGHEAVMSRARLIKEEVLVFVPDVYVPSRNPKLDQEILDTTNAHKMTCTPEVGFSAMTNMSTEKETKATEIVVILPGIRTYWSNLEASPDALDECLWRSFPIYEKVYKSSGLPENDVNKLTKQFRKKRHEIWVALGQNPNDDTLSDVENQEQEVRRESALLDAKSMILVASALHAKEIEVKKYKALRERIKIKEQQATA